MWPHIFEKLQRLSSKMHMIIRAGKKRQRDWFRQEKAAASEGWGPEHWTWMVTAENWSWLWSRHSDYCILRLPKRVIVFMLPAQMNAKHLPGCSCYIVGRNITWHSVSNSVHGKPPAGLPEPREWQTIFTSYTSDKMLTSKIYKELRTLNAKEIKLPISK